MVGWHHRLSGHEFKQTIGDSEGQESLGWCSPWGCKESDTTSGLNNNQKAMEEDRRQCSGRRAGRFREENQERPF